MTKKPEKPTSRPRKSAYVGAQIEEDLKAWIDQAAAARDVSSGSVIREALREYRERHGESKAA